MAFAWTQAEIDQDLMDKKDWTNDDDAQLKFAFELYGPQWLQISKVLLHKSPSQCYYRWSRLHPDYSRMKQQWTQEEDQQLRELVQKYGENWTEISQFLRTRTSGQIRNRFINKISAPEPTPWTPQEDQQLLTYFTEYGPKWTQIAKKFTNRSENMVKNRFYSQIANHKKVCTEKLKLSVPDKIEEPDLKTVEVTRPVKIDEKLEDTPKKQDAECQTPLVKYLVPKGLIEQFQRMQKLDPSVPTKFCWVPIPILRMVPK